MFLWSIAMKFAPWLISAILFGWVLDLRDDLAREKELCNADKLSAISEAEAIAREAVQVNLSERIRQLERNAETANQARAIAEQARIEAEQRPERVREVIRRIADSDSCLNMDVPNEVLQLLKE